MALVKLRDEIDLSSTMVGAHGAMFGICLLLMGVQGPRLVWKLGERTSFLAAMGSVAVGAVLYTTAFHVIQSLAGAAAIGLGAATIVVVIPTLVDRLYTYDKDEVFGKLNAWPSGVGIAQGPLLALFMRSTIGWRLPTAIWVLTACALATGFGARTLPNTRSARPTSNPLRLLRSKPLRLATIRNGLGVVCEFTFVVFVGTLLKELLDVSPAVATAAGAIFGLGGTAARMIGHRLLPLLGTQMEFICYAVGAVASLAFALPTPMTVRLLAVAVFGFAVGPIYVFGTGRMFLVGDNDPGVAGLGAFASGVSIAIGPVVVGVLSDLTTWQSAALFFPVMCTVGATWSLLSDLEAFGAASTKNISLHADGM